jgi:hypothetical protein
MGKAAGHDKRKKAQRSSAVSGVSSRLMALKAQAHQRAHPQVLTTPATTRPMTMKKPQGSMRETAWPASRAAGPPECARHPAAAAETG